MPPVRNRFKTVSRKRTSSNVCMRMIHRALIHNNAAWDTILMMRRHPRLMESRNRPKWIEKMIIRMIVVVH